MSFLVKQLRELFSFPGEPDDRGVDIILEDANGGGVAVGTVGPAGSELGTDLAMPIVLPPGYYLTTKNPTDPS